MKNFLTYAIVGCILSSAPAHSMFPATRTAAEPARPKRSICALTAAVEACNVAVYFALEQTPYSLQDTIKKHLQEHDIPCTVDAIKTYLKRLAEKEELDSLCEVLAKKCTIKTLPSQVKSAFDALCDSLVKMEIAVPQKRIKVANDA